MTQPEIEIAGRKIGPAHPPYIIAEMSANHNQDFAEAKRIVDAAAESGAHAIKLQTYTPDTMTIDSRKEWFMIGKGTIWEGKNLYELYGEAYTPWEWQKELMEYGRSLGMHSFSTPFDTTSVDFLEECGVPAYKIASFELVDLPLIAYVAKQGRPMVMSTGMATLSEIEEAVTTAKQSGATQLGLFKCNSAYPAPAANMHLRTIPHLQAAFNCPVGLSDHTLGSAAAVAAVALGASMIEKHFTLSRDVPGPDSAFSLEPHEFKQMAEQVTEAFSALGDVRYQATEGEKPSMVFRKSIFAVEDIPKGTKFDSTNVRVIRPGYGMHSRHLTEVIGRSASRDIERGTPLSWDLISGGGNE